MLQFTGVPVQPPVSPSRVSTSRGTTPAFGISGSTMHDASTTARRPINGVGGLPTKTERKTANGGHIAHTTMAEHRAHSGKGKGALLVAADGNIWIGSPNSALSPSAMQQVRK